MPKPTDPALNEFVYFVLYNSGDQKHKLPTKFAQMAGNEKKAKQFSIHSSLDQKIELLAALDIRFYWIFADRDTATLKTFRAVIKKAVSGDRADLLKELIEMKIFVTSDRSLSHNMSVMESVQHSTLFEANLGFMKQPFHNQNWSPTLDQRPRIEQMKEWFDSIADFLATLGEDIGHARAIFDLDKEDIFILSRLYVKRSVYIPDHAMKEAMVGHLTKRDVSTSLKNLHERLFVNRISGPHGYEYTISGKGLSTLDKFMLRLSRNIRR